MMSRFPCPNLSDMWTKVRYVLNTVWRDGRPTPGARRSRRVTIRYSEGPRKDLESHLFCTVKRRKRRAPDERFAPALNRCKVRAPWPAWPQPRVGVAWILLMIWLGFAGVAAAQPVILHLRGGDRLSGTITAEDTNLLVITTMWGKQMVVPTGEILKREPLLAAPAAKTVETKPSLAGAGGSTNTLARTVTAAVGSPVSPIKPKPPKRWTGEAQVGVDLVFSERNRQLYSGRLKAGYAHGHLRNLFDYSAAYGKTDGLLSDNRMSGSAKTDYDLARRIYVYNLGGAGFDEIRKIDLRYEEGPGFGYNLGKLTNFVRHTAMGGKFQAQYQSDNTKTELFYYPLAEKSNLAVDCRIFLDAKFQDL